MNRKQDGFISAGIMTMLIAGLALGGLLFYSAQSGHELPIWPAIAVSLVNLVAAGKIILDMKKTRRLRQEQALNAASQAAAEKTAKAAKTSHSSRKA